MSWMGAAPADDEDALARADLKRRASAGVFIVGTRGVAILLLALIGNVIVARLLTPHDFGVVAFGMSVVLLGGLLSDGGLGSALIRRAEPPDREELQALTALQLMVTAGLALLVAAAAAPFGEIGWITALMVSSMPLVALQFPGRILLERSLRYRPLAVVELSQVLTYHAWAIGFVIAGFGVWGLASASFARAAVAALIMAKVSPVGLVRPRVSWRRIRPLMGFGVRFQATTATWLLRDQGLNAAIALTASVSTLGLWSLARRMLEIPYLLLQSLWRVSFPTMSQLQRANVDTAPLIERAISIAAVGTGVILTGLAGSAPGLIPGVFGEQWREASSVVPGACLGLGIGGPVSVATQGYLYAVGDASAVLRAVVFQTIALFCVTVPLLHILGISAVGLGLFISSVVEAVVLARATREWTRVRVLRNLLPPVGIGVVSSGAGWTVSVVVGADLLSGAIGGVCSVLCFLVGLLVFCRNPLFDTVRFAVRAIRASTAG